jgi:hypothetical protein
MSPGLHWFTAHNESWLYFQHCFIVSHFSFLLLEKVTDLKYSIIQNINILLDNAAARDDGGMPLLDVRIGVEMRGLVGAGKLLHFGGDLATGAGKYRSKTSMPRLVENCWSFRHTPHRAATCIKKVLT